MSLSPAFFAITFYEFSVGGLALMSVLNTVYTVGVSYSNREAYNCSTDLQAQFLQSVGGEYIQEKFLTYGVPIAFLTPFVFDDVQRRPGVSRALEAWARLNGRVLLGATPRARARRHRLPADAHRRLLPATALRGRFRRTRGGGFRRGGVRGERRVVSTRRRGGGCAGDGGARGVDATERFDAVARCASR